MTKTPHFTRQDYDWIASVINECPLTNKDRITLATHFANNLSLTNPHFDRTKFLAACGIQDNK